MEGVPPMHRDRLQEKLDELSELISSEMDVWRENQIHPSMIQTDHWLQDCAIGALSKYVVEKLGGGDQKELDIMFKEIFLERTRYQRERLLQAKARSQIINPNGFPFENN